MHDRTRDMRVGSVLNVEYFHRNQEQVPASSTQTLGRSNPSTVVLVGTRVEVAPRHRTRHKCKMVKLGNQKKKIV